MEIDVQSAEDHTLSRIGAADPRAPLELRSAGTVQIGGPKILAIPTTAWLNQPADNTGIGLAAQHPTGLNYLDKFRRAAPRMSLGWLRPLAPLLGDPRLGMTGIFLQLSRILPDEYPLTDDVDSFLSDELGFGRLLDFGVIVSRLQQIDDWSAHEPGEPGLRACTRDGAMTYAWPFEERGVWQARDSVALQLAHHLLPPTHARQTRAEELTSFRSPGSGVARSVAQWEPEMSPGSGPGREGMVSQRWLTHAG